MSASQSEKPAPPLIVGVDIGSYYARIAIWGDRSEDDTSRTKNVSLVSIASILGPKTSTATGDRDEEDECDPETCLRSVVRFVPSQDPTDENVRIIVGERPFWFQRFEKTKQEEEEPDLSEPIPDAARTVHFAPRSDWTSDATLVDPLSALLSEHYPQEISENRHIPQSQGDEDDGRSSFTMADAASQIGMALIDSALAHDHGTFRKPSLPRAVLTVPTCSPDHVRQAVKDSGSAAGFDVLRLVNEATSACIAYGLDSPSAVEERIVVVVDVGALSTKVAVILLEEGIFEVVATASSLKSVSLEGSSTPFRCGGVHFTLALVDYFRGEIKKRYHWDVAEDSAAMVRLQRECERAKKRLSNTQRTMLKISNFLPSEGGDDTDSSFSSQISRVRFEAICKTHFSEILRVIQKAMTDARVTPFAVHDVVLVGGSCRIPKIRESVVDFFHGRSVHDSIPPEEVVVVGAAIQAAVLCSAPTGFMGLLDVIPLSVGFAVISNVATAQQSSAIITPLIRRNTTIPARKSASLCVDDLGQTELTIGVFEGERPLAKHCRCLGAITIPIIHEVPFAECFGPCDDPSRPLTPKLLLKATANVDANGLITLSAEVESLAPTAGSGPKSSLRELVCIPQKLSNATIDDLVRQGEQSHDEDLRLEAQASRSSLHSFAVALTRSYEQNQGCEDEFWVLRRGMILALASEATTWVENHQEECTEKYESKRALLEGAIRAIIFGRSRETRVAETSSPFPGFQDLAERTNYDVSSTASRPMFEDLDVD